MTYTIIYKQFILIFSNFTFYKKTMLFKVVFYTKILFD